MDWLYNGFPENFKRRQEYRFSWAPSTLETNSLAIFVISDFNNLRGMSLDWLFNEFPEKFRRRQGHRVPLAPRASVTNSVMIFDISNSNNLRVMTLGWLYNEFPENFRSSKPHSTPSYIQIFRTLTVFSVSFRRLKKLIANFIERTIAFKKFQMQGNNTFKPRPMCNLFWPLCVTHRIEKNLLYNTPSVYKTKYK